ncbi:magnesium transporter [Vibrio chaetopteri]|jgi:magnesium transporter|uniref:Magnesium transporter n=1 Tax=Vibrio chaetopteri TaxID=3016528 RepID=A0AAU8BQ10_9VIBR
MTLISLPFPTEEAEKLYYSVLDCISTKNSKKLCGYLNKAESIQLSSVVNKLTNGERVAVWTLLAGIDASLAANLLDHFSDNELVSLISQLPVETTLSMFHHLRSGDRRILINELPYDLQQQLKRSLPQAWKNEERAALNYASDSAGGICKSEILKMPDSATIETLGEILNAEEQNLERLEWRYVYLHDQEGNYVGGLKIRDVISLPGGSVLKNSLDPSIPVISPESDLTAIKSTLDTTLHAVIPVIDDFGFQIGVVGFKHLNEALYERSKQQLLEQSGVLGGDEFRTMPTIKRNLRRLAFLLPSVVLSYAAVSIIAAYEPIIEKIAVLAAILPLVANLSGAAGNQAVAVSIRELSTGQISAKDVLYVVAKEIPIGVVNGILIGSVLALLTYLTQSGEVIGLPLFIGLAYSFSSTFAVMIGGSLPLILKRFNLDPAMLSSPILTTLTDAISFFSVLYLAQMFLL